MSSNPLLVHCYNCRIKTVNNAEFAEKPVPVIKITEKLVAVPK
jgi:hypothetical protein